MKEGFKNEASISLWEFVRKTWSEGLLLGTLKDMPSKALKMGVCFHRGPVLGNMRWRSFPKAFERRENFLFLLGKLL